MIPASLRQRQLVQHGLHVLQRVLEAVVLSPQLRVAEVELEVLVHDLLHEIPARSDLGLGPRGGPLDREAVELPAKVENPPEVLLVLHELNPGAGHEFPLLQVVLEDLRLGELLEGVRIRALAEGRLRHHRGKQGLRDALRVVQLLPRPVEVLPVEREDRLLAELLHVPRGLDQRLPLLVVLLHVLANPVEVLLVQDASLCPVLLVPRTLHAPLQHRILSCQ
mmetsp:Transcript_5438/g.16476  ORF Transcript_5438/g.16476 Transcript_5438/m.16476 type:complete len:222 (+) Transcript_5438:308-973(+)